MTDSIRYQGAIIHNHHILLLKQIEHASGRSYWQIPGGAIEPDGTEEQCVQREMLEETGLSVRVNFLLLDSQHRAISNKRKRGTSYSKRQEAIAHIHVRFIPLLLRRRGYVRSPARTYAGDENRHANPQVSRRGLPGLCQPEHHHLILVHLSGGQAAPG